MFTVNTHVPKKKKEKIIFTGKNKHNTTPIKTYKSKISHDLRLISMLEEIGTKFYKNHRTQTFSREPISEPKAARTSSLGSLETRTLRVNSRQRGWKYLEKVTSRK